MAVKAVVAVQRIVTNAINNARVDVVVTGCVVGPDSSLLGNPNGTFTFDIGDVNPDLSAAQMQTGLINAVKNFLATFGISFSGSDTVRTLTSIS